MIQMEIPGAVRTAFGKGNNRQLRMRNMTPGVLYKGGAETIALQFDSNALHKSLFEIHGRNAVITLKVDGDSQAERHVVVQDLQREPIGGGVLHVDFLQIDLEKEISFEVPLQFTGKARGVDMGGDLQITKTSLMVKGCPLDVPDVIEADITTLDKGGKGLLCSDLAMPERVSMLDGGDTICAIVY